MANQFLGTQILFGCAGANVTLGVGMGDMTLIQSMELSDEAKEEMVADATGNTKAVGYYDHLRKLSLEWVVNGSSTNSGSMTVTAMPTIGGTVTVTGGSFTPATGKWIVQSANANFSNTKALLARVSLIQFINNTVPA